MESQFVILANVDQYKIDLVQQGLNVLDQFDFCSIVTIVGQMNDLPLIGNQSFLPQNCVLVQNNPSYSPRLKRYVILMRVKANDPRALNVAHTFCALLSHAVIVANYDRMDLQFLNAPASIIGEKQFNSKIGALVGVTEDGQLDVIQNNDKFRRAIEQQGVQTDIFNRIYSDCTGYQIPPGGKLSSLQPTLQNIIESRISISNLLIHGQVIYEYAINMAQQFNTSNKIYPSKAEDEIEVEEQFDNYLAVVDKYNSKCKNTLGNQVQTDLPARLQAIRYETQQEEVLKYNPHYSKKMGRYMQRKEQELITLNQQFNDAYNLNLLQKQSNKSLQQIRNNPNISQQDITAEIDRITARYNEKSRGNNKHKLLTQFLQVFVPSVYAEADIPKQMDKKINTLSKENKNLEDELTKLQKKSSSKCCTIM